MCSRFNCSLLLAGKHFQSRSPAPSSCLSVKASADCKSSNSHVFPEDGRTTWVLKKTGGKKDQSLNVAWRTLTEQTVDLLIRDKKGRTWGIRLGHYQTKITQNSLMKKWTCLDIIQDYRVRCPGGIYSLWPWEMWWQQHIWCRETRRDEARRSTC